MEELSGMCFLHREQYKKWREVKEALREAWKLYPNEPEICGEEIQLTIIKDENESGNFEKTAGTGSD